MRRLLLALALLGCAAPAAAREVLDYHEFKPGDAVTIDPDAAYLLVRTIDIWGLRFVRLDGEDGMRADRSKLAELPGYTNFDKSLPVHTHLLRVVPGTYWLYGEKTSGYLEGPFLNCLCMGTVRFEAKAGTITDLGTIRDLAKETANGKRPDARGVTRQLLGTRDLRAVLVAPAAPGDPLPAALAALPRVPADYRAAGSLPNIDGTMIDRVSAMPGVIAYDRDRIIDVKTGRALK